MKWNQKGIFVCVILFLVIMGALLIQGTKSPVKSPVSEEKIQYGAEEDVVSRADTSQSVNPTKKPEQTPKQKSTSKDSKNKSLEKTDSKKKESKKEQKATSSKKEKKTVKEGKIKPEKKAKATKVPGKKEIKTTANPTQTPVNQVSFEIECKKILDKKDLWKKGIEEVIPVSGIYYSGTCSFSKGESVYDLLKRVTKENNIALDSVYTPLYGTYYVKGIGGLYEFDCGNESGWMYSVNGQAPDVGASKYEVSNGDKIVFYYVYEY